MAAKYPGPSGQQKGKDAIKDEKVHVLKYELLLPQLNHRTELATSCLKMPSGLHPRHDAVQNLTEVVMNVKNTDDIHCLNLMLKCAHRNILCAKTATEGEDSLVVWTEAYTGRLSQYIENLNTKLGFGVTDAHVHMIPSHQLKGIVSQILDGIDQLRSHGHYHGHFTLEDTYYHLCEGNVVVKLTNFRRKAKGTLLQFQVEDFWDVAHALDCISHMAKKLKMEAVQPTLDTCQLDDLSEKLKQVSKQNLGTCLKDIRRHVFFWDKNDRKEFFVHDVPLALRSLAFRNEIKASQICKVPWDGDDYRGLLKEMNDYRVNKGMSKYDGSNKADYCQMCSGLYTHEFELHSVKGRSAAVDEEVQHQNPRLCFELFSRMPKLGR